MQAIVYESNTGYTKQYAKMLSKKTGLPAYSLKDAQQKLNPGTSVFFMGWLMGGMVQGVKKAKKCFDVRGVCGVGTGAASDETLKGMMQGCGTGKDNTFHLQGGFDMNKLRGMYKLLMKIMVKPLVREIEKKENKTSEDLKAIAMLKKGGSNVSEENLSAILAWFNK